jgi:hypothetical protein
MAGKTLTGIGEIEDESGPLDPADAADSHPYYSGPTVVDDVKVEAGLQKLRSLESQAPLIGMTRTAVDAIDPTASRPTPPAPIESATLVGHLGAEPQREAGGGQSVNERLPDEQPPVTSFDDRALRGTMYGHSIHLPDIDLPVGEEPPQSGPHLFAELGNDAAAKVPYGEPRHLADADLPDRTPPPDRFGGQTIDISQLRRPQTKHGAKLVIGAAGIVVLVLAAIIWMHTSDAYQPDPHPPASQVTTTPPPPPSTAAPSLGADLPSPRAPMAAPPPPAAIPAPREARTIPTEPAARTGPTSRDRDDGTAGPAHGHAAVEQPTSPRGDSPEASAGHEHRPRSASVHPSARHAASNRPPDPAASAQGSPARPGARPKRLEDDPDGTMAPSIE